MRYLEEAVIAGWQHSVGDEQAPEGAGAYRAKAEADGAVLGLQYYGDAIERSVAVQQVDVTADFTLVGIGILAARFVAASGVRSTN